MTGYYPNRFAHRLILAMRAELGEFSTETLLEQAGLDAGLPDESLERTYPFAHLAALNRALFATYGDQGAKGLALTIGRAWFNPRMANFGAFAAFTDPAFQQLPIDTRTTIALQVLAGVFTRLRDQGGQGETAADIPPMTGENRPFVYDGAQMTVCYLFTGLIQGCLTAATGQAVPAVTEVECRAAGAPCCRFAVGRVAHAKR